MHLNLIYRGKPLTLSGDDAVTLGDLRTQVCTALSVPADNVRLLADGKLLPPESNHANLAHLFRPAQTVLVLATNSKTVANVKEAKPDTTVRPFDAKAPKYVATPQKTFQTSTKYGFGSVHALPNLPNSNRARQILEQLASDRGFLAVMEKKRWNVGELREMPPEGRVGVDPVCVLGFNTNKGQQIHLRLRTDDMTGFRAMSTIRQVLAHELAHNEFSDHDDNFKELMRWIEKTAARDNWRSLGQRLDDGWNAPDFGAGPASLGNHAGSLVKEMKLGSENGSTGVSRLLQAYETKLEKRDSGSAEENPVAVVRIDANGVPDSAEEGEEESGRRSEDEARSTSESKTDGSTGGSHGGEGTEMSTRLADVINLGFSKALAKLAMRENGGDATRAVDWLLAQSSTGEMSGAMGEAESEVTARVQRAVNSLDSCLNRDELVLVLDTLHVYMSNVLRHGGVQRFCRINSENSFFKRRVGGFEDAVEVLRLAGFRLEQGVWEYKSLDVSCAWIVKSVIQEKLLRELMQR